MEALSLADFLVPKIKHILGSSAISYISLGQYPGVGPCGRFWAEGRPWERGDRSKRRV